LTSPSVCCVCLWAVVGVVPQFTEKLHSQRVREGGSARFVARVSGNPPPEVTWYREGVQMTSSPDFIISSQADLHSLSITEVFREDAGKFTARASNQLGQVQCVADLIVERMFRSPSVTFTRSFRVTVARAWNSLPTSITALTSLPSFKRQLNTFLFTKSFPSV